MNTPPIVSKCNCCGTPYTMRDWCKLALLGIQHIDDDFEDLELRNCTCGDTLAIEAICLCERGDS